MSVLPLRPGDPDRLGRFRLTGRLGEGGQGIVFLGEGAPGEMVAVKVLKTATDPAARARLADEMAAAQRVRRFCTAKVIDSSVDGPLPYIVSEYVDGPSLQARVAERGPLDDGALDRLVVSTLTALITIHNARIIHRDLKPANVLIGPDGPRVVDFGIARPVDRQTVSGQIVGTPPYLSPEQWQGEPATQSSDVFAWAGTMVFAATGHPPFRQQAIAPLIHAIVNDPPDLSGVPAGLRGLLAACLAKDPAERPTARELYDELVGPMDGPQPPPPPPPPTGPEPGRNITRDVSGDTPTPPPEAPLGPPPPVPTPDSGGRSGPNRTVLAAGALALTAVLLAAGAWALLGRGDSGLVIPDEYGGAWSGEVFESTGIDTHTSTVTIELTAGRDTARLTSAICTGGLTLTERRDDRLVLTFQTGPCARGQVILERRGGGLDYQLRGAGANTGGGTLSRAG